MKAIRRFLSPSDAAPQRESKSPRRSLSMRFRTPSQTSRPASQNSSISAASSLVSSSHYSSTITSRTPSFGGGGVVRRSTRGHGMLRRQAALDAEDHPRVIATIMQNASRPALLKLRLVSRSFRDMADAELARHLVLSAPVGVSSLRVTAPLEDPTISGGREAGIPGLSVRVLWNRGERRRLTRILTGTRVVDLRGPSRARDPEIADLTLQCSCARVLRLRPDSTGNPPTACPLPPRVTDLIAFTNMAADRPQPDLATSRRASWLVTDREHLHLQPSTSAYVGPIPNRIQSLVVTVRYPRAHAPSTGGNTLAASGSARTTPPPRPLRPLAPWDHPASLREVTVIFIPDEAGLAPVKKPRPRSFLGRGPAPTADGELQTPIFQQHSTLRPRQLSSGGASIGDSRRLSWLSNSPVSPTFSWRSGPPTPTYGHAQEAGLQPPIDPAFPATPVPTIPSAAPALVFADADAERTGNIGFLSPFIRSVAAHLPRVAYTLVDISRIDPVVLGLPAGMLLSPRQIERLVTSALRAELLYTGWNEGEIDGLLRNLRFAARAEYAARVGAAAFELQTVE